MKNMQVTKIENTGNTAVYTKRPTQEQLQREFNYIQAERITKKLLEKGLITIVEYDRIMGENRRVFSPFLATIL